MIKDCDIGIKTGLQINGIELNAQRQILLFSKEAKKCHIKQGKCLQNMALDNLLYGKS